MDDPRFRHVASDPRFKSVPRRARTVKIDSRFQSMFTDKKFKVKYAVDRRGRKVKQTSSEDLRKYYDLDKDEVQETATELQHEADENRDEDVPRINDGTAHLRDDVIHASDDVASDSESDADTDSSSTDVDGLTFDLDESPGDIVHDWGEMARGGEVPHADDISHRLAICNMDWDRISANDIFVLLSSFKPRGGSIVSVTVYPSDYGLERLAREEKEGPPELADSSGEEEEGNEATGEGRGYSMEKLRCYQLNRLKYFYAVAVCDSRATAEAIYNQCDGMEYECSGGQVDLRFIPDDVTFDDREPKSVATENSIPSNYAPSNFVSTALQQSKVEMTWDETDPKRLQTTMRKFTKDDLQSMDFGAYLASSSSDDSNDEGEGPSGRSLDSAVNEIERYKSLLKEIREDKGQSSAEEEMEITWEPGLKETAKDLVKKKNVGGKGDGKETTWEKYVAEKKQKRKEKKTKSKGIAEDGAAGGEEREDGGFDDPFFQHSVTTATAKSKKAKKGKLTQEEIEKDRQEKTELELLMLDDDKDGDTREHFHLKAIMKLEKKTDSKQRRKRKRHGKLGDDSSAPVDDFEVDLHDKRFNALYESHLYAPDPANPLYRPTKAMESIMKERLKRSHHSSSGSKQRNSNQPLTDSSVVSLVNSVKSKTSSFREKQKRRRKHRPLIQL